jgi:hypothetical protein
VHRGRALIACGAAILALVLALARPVDAHATRPRAGAVVTAPPLLNWRGVPGALLYNVQLWRDGRKILSRFPTLSRFQLGAHWRYRGVWYRLRPATYRWLVWPWLGNRYGRLRANRTFVFVHPPTNVELPRVIGPAREGELLTASRGRWRGTRPLEFSYAWQSCSATGCAAISGATAATFRLRAADIDRTVRVVVRATNRARTTAALSAMTPVVLAAPPRNVARPRASGHFQIGRSLTARLGAWRSSRPMTFAVSWLRCDADSCAPIADASAPTYALGRGDFERRLRVRVTATNSGGATSVVSPRTPRIGRVVEGTSQSETLRGSSGTDVVRGRRGNDHVVGGWGADTVSGGRGNDRIAGGRGGDRIFARDGRWDAIECGSGVDVVVADVGDQVSQDCERVRRG